MKLKIAMINVSGLEAKNKEIKPQRFDVRFSKDQLGQTLSISNGDTMFVVPFEPIAKLIIDKFISDGGEKAPAEGEKQ